MLYNIREQQQQESIHDNTFLVPANTTHKGGVGGTRFTPTTGNHWTIIGIRILWRALACLSGLFFEPKSLDESSFVYAVDLQTRQQRKQQQKSGSYLFSPEYLSDRPFGDALFGHYLLGSEGTNQKRRVSI